MHEMWSLYAVDGCAYRAVCIARMKGSALPKEGLLVAVLAVVWCDVSGGAMSSE